jgi:CheY-like chemotaxis protein
VVDDNEDIGELFKRYLEAHLYQVVLAKNGQEALQTVQKIQPFAVILDLMMPDMDGWDLLQIFLNQPDTLAIPVIICSILRQKELALSLGATAFLEKPVSEETLISLLALLIETYRRCLLPKLFSCLHSDTLDNFVGRCNRGTPCKPFLACTALHGVFC